MKEVPNNGIVKSTCGLCYAMCGILVHLDNGRITKVEGDPESPTNKGALCAKGLASLEYLYHPDRLKHPLKRVGRQGSGKWRQISWDEALDIVAGELTRAKNSYGAESVAFIRGGSKGGLQDDCLARFANAFGTPNIASPASVCFIPQMQAEMITYGFHTLPDYECPPACTIVWGANRADTHIVKYQECIRALDKGTKLVVIDPFKTELAKRADIWVQLRPGADLALALAMISVLVNEGLFDEDFVKKWTVGFEELRAHIQNYSPQKVSEITWVDAETIEKVARFYATNKPACIQSGNAVDHSVNSFQTARALSILRAITGNLGVPGGEAQWFPVGLLPRNSPKFDLRDEVPPERRARRISSRHGLLPINFYTLPQDIPVAILEGEPCSIHAIYVQGDNPLVTYSNAQEVHKAFQKLDFLVVADLFMTPTAELADIVLPVASYLEFDSLHRMDSYPKAVLVQQKVAHIDECWSDTKILNELAKRLGLDKYAWEHEDQILDDILKPLGLTFDEFRKVAAITATKKYRSYDVNGFETPSRKVELYSSKLEEWGFEPLPTYYEPPETPYSEPELVKEYPLILTSWKQAQYWHSGNRQITSLRSSHPEPLTKIHPKTASRLRIKEGDQVYIETRRGRIRQTATLTPDIDPRVVAVDYAWWFPEKAIANLHGWAESNINILTDDKTPFNREMGSANLRGHLCKVYKIS